MPEPKTSPTLEEMNSELQAVLESPQFQRAPALAKFLRFICQEYFEGRAGDLKEYTIAMGAFGRPGTFQAKEDAIVRVQAIRMRNCLKEYYRAEGRSHRIQIRLPKGAYIPEFRLIGLRPKPQISTSSQPLQEEPSASPVIQNVADVPDSPVVAEIAIAPKRQKPLLLMAGVVSIAAIVVFLYWMLYSTHQHESLSPFGGTPQRQAVLTPPTEEMRILVGNSNPRFVDQLGRVWGEDRFSKGGHVGETLYNPSGHVDDPDLWRHFRTGESFEYDIPLKSGSYELHLFFLEPEFGENTLSGGGETSRVFDVFANDRRIMDGFDIVQDAGGARNTDEKVFTDISPASDGVLHLKFAGRNAAALVNAIEVIPTPPGRMRPIRITTRNVEFFSKDQVQWGADRYYSSGRSNPVRRTVTGTDDPELYYTERYGNFNYTIPVAPGKYTAILHFSESYFGPSNTGKQGAGSRIFDMYFNGVALLRDFDIFREAGGENRALRKEFRGLRPNAQGKLVFTFQPVRNGPCINAIEIIPE